MFGPGLRFPFVSDIPDLQDALNGKEPAGTVDAALESHLEADNPHPQYALADLTTADVEDSSDRRYVSDAEREVLQSTSGVNTGDQDLSGLAPVIHEHLLAEITDAAAALDLKADLIDGVLPTSQLPALAIVEFLGAVESEEAMLELIGQRGDWCIRTDLERAFFLTADDPAEVDSWQQITTPGSPVLTVNGQTGEIVLGFSDVGAAPAAHTHEIADILNLLTTLAGKANLSGGTFTGNVGINGALTVRGSNGIVMGDSVADNTAKSARIMMHSYGSIANSFCLFLGSAQQQYNVAVFGGGTAAGYAATHLRFVAAPNNTTPTGTTVSDWTFDKARFYIPVQLPIFTVATVPTASVAGAGAMIYCSDGDAGQPCIAVSNGGSWRRLPLGTFISAT